MNITPHFQEFGGDSKLMIEETRATRRKHTLTRAHRHHIWRYGKGWAYCRLIHWFKIPGKSPVQRPQGRRLNCDEPKIPFLSSTHKS